MHILFLWHEKGVTAEIRPKDRLVGSRGEHFDLRRRLTENEVKDIRTVRAQRVVTGTLPDVVRNIAAKLKGTNHELVVDVAGQAVPQPAKTKTNLTQTLYRRIYTEYDEHTDPRRRP